MAALDRNPESLNFFAADGWTFYVKRSPNTNFYVQDFSLPEVSFGTANHFNPFLTINLPGDHLSYGPLQISFKVDEKLSNYLEMWNWIRKLGFPNNWDERKALIDAAKISGLGETSDLLLMLHDSNRLTKFEITFKDAFPVYMSGLKLSSRNTAIDYLTCDVIFAFTGWDIEAI